MGSTAGFGIQGVGNAASAYAESESIKAQGGYQRRMGNLNADLAESQSGDALKRAEGAVRDNKNQTRQKVGAQRASLAASGVDVGSGSAAQLQQDTELTGVQDEQTIRNNAIREAWGYRIQASNARAQGNFASITARGQANQTLINGGMRAAGNAFSAYGSYKDNKNPNTKKKG
jgi:hypothetical protein